MEKTFAKLNKEILDAIDNVQKLKLELIVVPWWDIKNQYRLRKQLRLMDKFADQIGDEMKVMTP